MRTIKLPNGETKSLEYIVEDLERDNIRFMEPNEEMYDFCKTIHNSDLQARIIASRFKNMDDLKLYYNSKLKDFMNKEFMIEHFIGLEEASDNIIEAIKNNEYILVVIDYDTDGVTSGAIIHKFLKNVFNYDNFDVLVNKREFGNGINNNIRDKIIKINRTRKIGLVLTADHGSHDKENLTTIKDNIGCKVVVTDHHLIDLETAPYNMDGFVNPQRDQDPIFKYISGTHVAYYVMLYSYLKYLDTDIGKLEDKKTEDYIYYLLTYVGLTIISDCMDLSAPINRKIFRKAFSTINSRKVDHEPFWEYIIRNYQRTYVIDETVLGFNVIPVLNTPGRLGEPRISYEVLVAESVEEVEDLQEELLKLNDDRKHKQQVAISKKDEKVYATKYMKIVILDNADGIQGTVANNILYEDNLKLVCCFTPKVYDGETIYIGSGRSTFEDINIKDLIKEIEEETDIILTSGGHKAAVGIKLKGTPEELFKELKNRLERRTIKHEDVCYIEDYIFSMKRLLHALFDMSLIRPFGIGFPNPLFASDFYVTEMKVYKKSQTYLALKVKFNPDAKSEFRVFYTVKKDEEHIIEDLITKTRYIRMVYEINISTYANTNKIQLMPTKIFLKYQD